MIGVFGVFWHISLLGWRIWYLWKFGMVYLVSGIWDSAHGIFITKMCIFVYIPPDILWLEWSLLLSLWKNYAGWKKVRQRRW